MKDESLQIHAISVSEQPVELMLEMAGACCTFVSAIMSLPVDRGKM